MEEIVRKIGKIRKTSDKPLVQSMKVYDKLFAENVLHDYFGKTNDVMKRLKNISREWRK